MNNSDPRQTLLTSPMGALQIIVVFIAVGLNALDGFDVMSISFASIGIQREWHINKATLGAVLSMELIGMAVGSIVLGGLADRIGRRSTTLGCLVLMAIGMFMATQASGVFDLSIYRVLTGLGIGGVLAAVNALTAEFSNAGVATPASPSCPSATRWERSSAASSWRTCSRRTTGAPCSTSVQPSLPR